MSSSREESPDWLRTFQAPTQSILTLSSGSESSPNDSPLREDGTNEKKPSSSKETSQFAEKDEDQDTRPCGRGDESASKKTLKAKSPTKKRPKVEHTSVKKKKTDNRSKPGNDIENGSDEKAAKQENSEKHMEPNVPNNSVLTLSSDSESPHSSPIREGSKGKSPKRGLKNKDTVSAKKKKVNSDINKKENNGDVEVAEEEIAEKHTEPLFSSSRLPLVLSEKASRSKALVECEGESIDLSGDVGAVGRVVISDNPSGNQEMFLDLKGTIYKTAIVPSRSFCVVSFGPSEAKIEAIMNDFIQLKPQSNVYEAETMVEGTLDGFSFDSDDDADKMPKTVTNQTDQNEGDGEQSNTKTKTKAEKTSGVLRKRGGKAAGGKPPKKVRKKTQAPKKSKTKK
ncbi:DNA-binding protein BIN4 [Camellia lanceoleosa]|uniref:DNA-binding protein BIN4 n=1 Tax=Camellia lanceoleosa TaxID=1840588 RepID=A0ACC0FL83_9ERIC|nr:DNA-binding protein BIN4 [Camellia lanceoleosa]